MLYKRKDILPVHYRRMKDLTEEMKELKREVEGLKREVRGIRAYLEEKEQQGQEKTNARKDTEGTGAKRDEEKREERKRKFTEEEEEEGTWSRKTQEMREREKRKKNLIFKGKRTDDPNWRTEVRRILKEALGREVEVMKEWDRRDWSGGRIYIMELGREEDKEDIMKIKKEIEKRENLSIERDRTYEERRIMWLEREKERIEKLKRAKEEKEQREAAERNKKRRAEELEEQIKRLLKELREVRGTE